MPQRTVKTIWREKMRGEPPFVQMIAGILDDNEKYGNMDDCEDFVARKKNEQNRICGGDIGVGFPRSAGVFTSLYVKPAWLTKLGSKT